MENAMNLSQDKTLAVFNNASLVSGSTTKLDCVADDMQLGCYDYWPYYETYHHWYPHPSTITVTPNKTETAFKVVKVLINKKLAKIQTVKQFVETMDSIVGVL